MEFDPGGMTPVIHRLTRAQVQPAGVLNALAGRVAARRRVDIDPGAGLGRLSKATRAHQSDSESGDGPFLFVSVQIVTLHP